MWMACRSRSVTTSWAATRSTASMTVLSRGDDPPGLPRLPPWRSAIVPVPGLGRAHPTVRLRRDQPRILVDAPRAVAPRLGGAPDRRLHHPDRVAEPGNGRSFLELAAMHAVETDSLRLPGPVAGFGGDAEAEGRAGPGGAVGVGVGSQRAAARPARVEPEDPPVLFLMQGHLARAPRPGQVPAQRHGGVVEQQRYRFAPGPSG